jgi:hypothetical protein
MPSINAAADHRNRRMTAEIDELICCAQHASADRRYGDARVGYRRAEHLAREARLPRVRACAAGGWANAAKWDGCYPEALEGIDGAIEAWGQVPDARQRALALQERARILDLMNCWHEARLTWRKARAALHGLGLSWEVLHCDSAIEDLGNRIARQAREDR